MIRSRSYLFLIIIVLPLFEHGPRRTSGRSLKLRPEDVLTLIRRMTENCSKDGPNTRQLHVCPADPCPLIENDPIMSCLYEGSAEITIPKFRKDFSLQLPQCGEVHSSVMRKSER
jgi:hypothetical protein